MRKNSAIMITVLFASLVMTPFYVNKSAANPTLGTPELTIVSPEQGKTYNTNVPLALNITLFSNLASWEKLIDLYYCLDEKPKTKLTIENSSKSNEILISEILYNLSSGNHNLFVYGETDWGNIINSNVTFIVNSSRPINNNFLPQVTVLFPKNETYFSVGFKIDLTFQTNKPTVWARFSLDNQGNETIFGNTTIIKFASAGAHNIKVYFSDYEGNIGASETIQFTTVFLTEEGVPSPITPIISIAYPQNSTYHENEVPLNFSVNKLISIDGSKPNYPSISRIVYCLDGQNNVTIDEDTDTVLRNLSNGQHYITVYAEDIYGNIGASQTIFFSIQTEAFPLLTVGALICGCAVLTIAVFFYLRKSKSKRVFSNSENTVVRVKQRNDTFKMLR